MQKIEISSLERLKNGGDTSPVGEEEFHSTPLFMSP